MKCMQVKTLWGFFSPKSEGVSPQEKNTARSPKTSYINFGISSFLPIPFKSLISDFVRKGSWEGGVRMTVYPKISKHLEENKKNKQTNKTQINRKKNLTKAKQLPVTNSTSIKNFFSLADPRNHCYSL